ncbi:hypothetical protein [Amycolatopsis sp. FDAARGOS 1241]|uniref:hypothetical protein n=1 Tax=Amycolatopsis sp. FDAARGOS 1241 TaxID=2778070 RepID=UPI001EF2266A|nr:hypothetical protein [Amycolatopsis sp. FDAARGOS 1241]
MAFDLQDADHDGKHDDGRPDAVGAGARLLVAFSAPWWRRGRQAGVSGSDLARRRGHAARVVRADGRPGDRGAVLGWRRSCFQLVLATDALARRQVAQRRQEYLDEIDRRGRRGFLRRLDSGAKAGGDPGPYLTTGS